MLLCVITAIYGLAVIDKDVILPSIVGVLIFAIFFSIKRFSFILFTPNGIKIHFGFLAECQLSFSNIKEVTTVQHKTIYGIGVKMCGKGEVAIVTRAGNVVRLLMRDKDFIVMFKFVKITFISLRISPEKQDEFIEILKNRLS